LQKTTLPAPIMAIFLGIGFLSRTSMSWTERRHYNVPDVAGYR
jgi:hypothetical protein